MAKKIVWLFVSCLMVLSLLLASCGGDDPETPDDPDNPVTQTPDQPEDIDQPSVDLGPETETPVYGGKITIVNNADIAVWNPGAAAGRNAEQDGVMLEQILGVDRTAGPAGTGETNYVGGVADFKYVTGNLAESWSTPEVGVWVLDIRQGVYFTEIPGQPASELVGGREMTAEDVAASIEYMRDNPTSVTSFAEPNLIKNVTVERTGDWQITVNTPVAATTGYLWIMGGGGAQYVWPKEWLESEYVTSNNWYDVVGTGPYVVNDYVPGSVVRYVKNDKYWAVDPLGPGKGNQLPYADELSWQIIPDYSSRLALLRTGKADWSYIDILTREDFETISKSNPDIKWAQTIIDPIQVSGRVDLEDNPFSKLGVRQAMMMAIDYDSIMNDLYEGQAELIDSPARRWYPSIYVPFEELPDSVQELYSYNPEKAKDLLAEAGYPDGFSMKMVLQNSPDMEQAGSLLKAYWDAIGVDIQLDIKEAGIFTSMWTGYEVEDLMLSRYPGGTGALFVRYSLGYYRGPNYFNMSHVNNPPGTDPLIENAYDIQSENVHVNYPVADKALKDIIPYILEQAFLIPMPAPWGYRVWSPWLKNYYGEAQLKFWLKYAWVDQELKATMSN